MRTLEDALAASQSEARERGCQGTVSLSLSLSLSLTHTHTHTHLPSHFPTLVPIFISHLSPPRLSPRAPSPLTGQEQLESLTERVHCVFLVCSLCVPLTAQEQLNSLTERARLLQTLTEREHLELHALQRRPKAHVSSSLYDMYPPPHMTCAPEATKSTRELRTLTLHVLLSLCHTL